MYIGLPGGPNVTVEQLRALRFTQADFDRLRNGSEHGFLWSDAVKLSNKCPAFADAFSECCRRQLAAGQASPPLDSYVTPEFQAHCRRRLIEEGHIQPEAQDYDHAAPA
eukprot:485151-Heterocapsa_arctica.AAC.1